MVAEILVCQAGSCSAAGSECVSRGDHANCADSVGILVSRETLSPKSVYSIRTHVVIPGPFQLQPKL